ncbi:STT3 domain-containing protein [Campylobacter geochelonis]|uniref:General glycosylation pathway protein n=1 Tax=Campylobacter geochelonis TaxID=1780362 RepID=A0A128EEQ2_9BACT|nr:STT3 domain-containing protein [Campylobacter geochelonis]QKF71851.1 undecaprenyl-diphosphooligosaccharide--protein glycotransferase [Campylobacter geochelonis]CZE47404.1 general glycosylation pathway protein [Campylobacter geochelonis]
MNKTRLNSRILTIALIFIAFIFSITIRLYWVSWASGFEDLMYNGEVMINTGDGYAFAEGARDIIAGFHQPNDLSYVWSPLSKLTAFLYTILPVSFEALILYMSVFFSSLLVVPIVMIANEFRATKAGLIGALIACVANSYYNRTMAGYYDTDMLNITLAVFVLWGMIRVVVKQDRYSIILAPFFVLIYQWWYGSAFTLNSGFLTMFLLYTLVFERKSLVNYQTIILIILALSNLSFEVKFIAIFALFLLFVLKNLNYKIIASIGVVVFAVFAYKGGLNPIIFQLKFYILRDVAEVSQQGMVFKFFNVNQTIQESGIVPPEIFMNRISSHVVVFIISLFGYALLCYKHKEFLISLPLLVLGFLAVKAGLRFTIYAVPVMGLGFGFLVVYLLNLLGFKNAVKNSILVVITMLALTPAIKHIVEYKSPTVFFHEEVKVLDELKHKTGREDYVLAWWDYGYPIRYYSDVKTLVDGGKHLGNDNYPVSFSLFKDQTSSANMARLAVEYTERQFNQNFALLNQMLKDYNQTDIDDFLYALSFKSFELPQKTREIYYYLPKRMLNIFPVVTYFSNLDLKDGKSYKNQIFITAQAVSNSDNGLVLDNGMLISHDLTTINMGSEQLKIKKFYETGYDANKKLNVSSIDVDLDGALYLIFTKENGTFIIADEKAFKSTYVQLFVLENYDKELFEPVILDKDAKVYRLKR